MIDQSLFAVKDDHTRFLLLCLQRRFDPFSLDAARKVAAQNDFDWDIVCGLIVKERLVPLLYTIVHDQRLMPDWLEKEIRARYLRNAVRNTFLFKNLAQLLAELSAEDISVIVLKGAALADSVYSNVALRPMVDLDVLIQRGDVNRAENQLACLGYQAVEGEAHPGFTTEYENELLLRKTERIVIDLELHWSLLDSPHYQRKIDMDWFWDSAVPTHFSDTPALILCPEALLLHLCSHIMLHHRGQGLIWLHDVAEVLVRHRSSLDWQTVMNKAQEYDLVLPTQRILTTVCTEWNIKLAPGVLDEVNGLQPSSGESKVFNWLTAAERPVAQRFWVDLATSTGWRHRLRYAWRNLFPSTEYMRQRYDIRRSPLLPFYYPYRWLLGIFSPFKD